jgi:signal transduction histidine kinase
MDMRPAEEGQGIEGRPVLSSYAPISDLGWAVVVEEPLDLVTADLKHLQRYALLLLLVGLSVGAAVIVWVSRKITQPILELRQGVEIIGKGNLEHRADIRTGDEIEELAEEFNKMALALQKSYATLEQKVQQRTRELSALHDVTTTVNQSLELDTVLNAVIKKITELFQFEVSRVFLLNPETDLIELRASLEVNPEPWAHLTSFGRGESIVGRVVESGEPLIFEDIGSDLNYREWSTSQASGNAGMRLLAVFPIKTKSSCFGAIAFSSKAPRMLAPEEIRLLTSMSEQVGVAVENASLFQQAKIRSEHLAVLNEVGAAVSQSLDLGVVLREALDKVVETLRFDASWIFLLDPSDGLLHLKAYKGLNDETARAMSTRSTKIGISGTVCSSGRRLVFDDVTQSEQYHLISSKSRVSSLGYRASAAFPLRAKEKILGVLHVVNFATRHFASDELQTIELVAQEIGVAVENATLFAEVNKKTAELAKANQELQEATRTKSEFLAAMSHELRTPLNIIIGNADLTRDGFFGDLNNEQKESLQKISRHARVLLKMINDILALSRIEAKKISLDLSTVSVDEIIAYARTLVEQINRDNHLEVRWEVEGDLPPLHTDPIKLEEILQNLIGNAFKFTPQGRVEVRVRKLEHQDRVEFAVADTGIGIEADDLEKIFDEFEQIKGIHTGNRSGVGLGLSIVKKYLELMQGDIRVESQPGRGSTFIFSLPRSVVFHS